MKSVPSSNFIPAILRFLIVGFLLGGFTLPALAQNNPVPLINLPLVPDAVAPGGPGFTLTVNGTGFVAGSVVDWNGNARTTTFVTGSQVNASILASDIALASSASVTVVNPTPGGGMSNVVFLSVTNPTSYITTSLASSPATGTEPISVAVGDFNGDGILDLAVSNECGSMPVCEGTMPGTVSILLGDGMGNFTLASSPVTGAQPVSLAVGDFNGDGILDLAVSNECGNIPGCNYTMPGTVSVLLGDGTGNFTLASSPATGYEPFSVAAGDLNGDGKLDLAVANPFSDTVSILLGDGTGNFTLASSPATGRGPDSVAMGDFNGDGRLDLAVANGDSNTVSILLGDGAGNFSLVSSPMVGIGPSSLAVGDFNGDGKLDLAVANGSSDTVSILLGDGTGNFTLASSPGAGLDPQFVAVGDFNGDSKLDLAVANIYGNTVYIFLGDGTGNFTLASSPATGSGPRGVAMGDFNGDGKLDLAVANVTSNTVSVLLQGSTIVTLLPSNLSFGNQPVGTTSAPQGVMLTNSGSATLTISNITVTGADVGDFSQTNSCGTSVAVGASCTISVTFSPMAAGSRSAMVSITDNAGGSPQQVPLTGTGTVPMVMLSPTSLMFGNQNVGTTSAPKNVTLTNTGLAPLAISGISSTGDFAQTNTCGTSVVAGASCTISVSFSPTAPGKRIGSITITDNAQGSPQTVSLTGTGTAPAVTLAPSSLTFADQLLGTTSAAQTVTLTNTGTETLTITSIATSGPFTRTNTCGPTVAIGASCTITVTFTPTRIGLQTGDVTITDNAYNSPQQMVPLAGTGTEVKLTPSSLTFPVQLVGTSSAAMTVTITNVGSSPFTVKGFSITGTNAGDFLLSTNTCGTSLGAGQSCTISITFTPSGPNTRSATGLVMDTGGGSPQTIALSGTGTVVKLSAASLNFGSVMVGKISPPQSVILTNVGTTTLSITSIGVVGTDKGDFSASNTCGKSVAAGGTCSIIARFIPTKTGLRTATVDITDNGGGSPQMIKLSGTGT